jgi:hypothetical protein
MEPVKAHELKGFFTHVIQVLERLDIPYMVVGGFAAILYGQPRLTIDVDVVVDMEADQIDPFVAAFPIPDYYVSKEAVRDSLRRRYPCNVIQPITGAKVDLIPLPRDRFTREAFQRRRRVTYDDEGRAAAFMAPEDVVVAKLRAYEETESDRHLRDAESVLVMQWGALDLALMRRGARAADVVEALERLLEGVRREIEG